MSDAKRPRRPGATPRGDRHKGRSRRRIGLGLESLEERVVLSPSSTGSTGTATQLALSGLPMNLTAGQAYPVTVTPENGLGATVTGFTDTLHFSSTDPAAVLPADAPADGSGAQTFSVTFNTSGPVTLTVADGTDPSVNPSTAGNAVEGEHSTVFGLDDPVAIVDGPDGNLRFTDFTSDAVSMITPGGAVTEYPTPTSGSEPDGIAVGPDGNL